MSGYIALHRRLKNHWLWQDPIKLKWWIDILFSVNHMETKVLIKNKLLVCGRGESLKSLETWAKEWGVNRKLVHTFMKTLEKDGILVTKSETVTTRITVCKYDSYNVSGNDIDNAFGESLVTHRKRNRDTNNNDKNDKNKEEIVLPFNSEKFATEWMYWKDYKKKQHGFDFKSARSEQQSVNLLYRESHENEKEAIAMMQYAMAKGWQGWVPKDDVNFYSGKPIQNSTNNSKFVM